MIGEASLALGQANYQGARYAQLHGTYTQSQIQTFMLSVAAPTISANGGKYLSSTLNPTPPCTFGNAVTVSTTFKTDGVVALPNPFLGIHFPKTLTSSESVFCEGTTN